jgi:hypothetical protein
MRGRISASWLNSIVSTDAGLAATIGFICPSPVGGEVFMLTAPFIEPTIRKYLFASGGKANREKLLADDHHRRSNLS